MHQRKQDKEPGNHESLLQNQTSQEVAAIQPASRVSDLFPSQIPRFQGCQACSQWTKGYLSLIQEISDQENDLLLANTRDYSSNGSHFLLYRAVFIFVPK